MKKNTLCKGVTSQKVGEHGVFFAGFAGKKHPNPRFIEMIRKGDVS